MCKEFFMSKQNTNFKCPKENCDKEYNNIVSLSKHWKRTHKSDAEKLYKIVYKLEEIVKCACGCENETKFLGVSRGYSEYKRGHKSRVKNNFVSKKAQENSLKTRRKMIKDGTWKPFALKETGEAWNLGLTKETDKRIANMATAISGNKEETSRRSDRMKKGRLDGTIPTLYGKEHSQWKGGVSSLNHTCRANGNLYRGWVRVKLIDAKFQCKKCKTTGRLEVHHDVETFSSIMRKFASRNKWEKGLTEALEYDDSNLDNLKKKISNEVAEYHINNNVSGVVLCRSCHKKEHDKMNF